MVHGYYSIVVILISLAAAVCMYQWTKEANGSFFVPTISTFFMWFYIVFVFVGAVAMNIVVVDHWEKARLYARYDWLLRMWILAVAGAVLIPAGMKLSNWFWHVDAADTWRRFSNMLMDLRRYACSKRFLLLFFGVTALTVAVCYVYTASLHPVPIFEIFNHRTAEQLAKYRSDATNGFPGKYWRYDFFKSYVLLALFLVAFYLRKTRDIFRYTCYSLGLLNIFMCVMNLEKGPVLQFAIVLGLAVFYEKQTIPLRKILIAAGGLFGLTLLMYALFMKSVSLWGPFGRVFITQIGCVISYLGYVDNVGFLWGTSLPNPANVFPFEYVRLTVEVMNFAHPELAAKGIVGSMPTIFFAEIYANFGSAAAFLSMPTMGFLLRTLDNLAQMFLLQHRDVVWLAAYVYLVWFFYRYTVGGVLGIVFDQCLIGIVGLFFLFHGSAAWKSFKEAMVRGEK